MHGVEYMKSWPIHNHKKCERIWAMRYLFKAKFWEFVNVLGWKQSTLELSTLTERADNFVHRQLPWTNA